MSIKAIETKYAGCRFRSRIEARWAVFFDSMNMEWKYEPQGFSLPSGPYLPDFYLTNCCGGPGRWWEIKGSTPTEREIRLARELALAVAERDERVLIKFGDIDRFPVQSESGCYGIGSRKGPDREFTNAVRFQVDYEPRRASIELAEFPDPEQWKPMPTAVTGYSCPHQDWSLTHVQHSLDKARSARFEHGESPK